MSEFQTTPAESPLFRLYQRQFIDAQQLAAGEKLRADFERAQLQRRVTSSYAEASGSGGRHWQVSDNAIENIAAGALDARDRLQAAFEAVGPELSGILYQVCCLASGFEAAEATLTLPARSGKQIMLLALTRLARHYGLIKKHRPRDRTLISHWAMDDYRPKITPRQPHQP